MLSKISRDLFVSYIISYVYDFSRTVKVDFEIYILKYRKTMSV